MPARGSVEAPALAAAAAAATLAEVEPRSPRPSTAQAWEKRSTAVTLMEYPTLGAKSEPQTALAPVPTPASAPAPGTPLLPSAADLMLPPQPTSPSPRPEEAEAEHVATPAGATAEFGDDSIPRQRSPSSPIPDNSYGSPISLDGAEFPDGADAGGDKGSFRGICVRCGQPVFDTQQRSRGPNGYQHEPFCQPLELTDKSNPDASSTMVCARYVARPERAYTGRVSRCALLRS